MEIQEGQVVFLVGHRGAVSHKIGSVALELTVALSPEHALSQESESFLLVIPADYAEKVISSIQQSLGALRRSN